MLCHPLTHATQHLGVRPLGLGHEWRSDWCRALTFSGSTRAAIGSTLLRDRGASGPCSNHEGKRAGPRGPSLRSAAFINLRYEDESIAVFYL